MIAQLAGIYPDHAGFNPEWLQPGAAGRGIPAPRAPQPEAPHGHPTRKVLPYPQPAGQATLVRVARRHPRSDHPEPHADVGVGATVYRNLDPVQCVRAESKIRVSGSG